MSEKKAPLLLEIGTEEIPARFLPPTLAQMKERAGAVFQELAIDCAEIRTHATPRRLTLIAEGIPSLQRDRVKEVFGPPKKAAFLADGTPSQAAAGFAASLGVEVSRLTVKKKDKGEYVVAVVEEKGTAVKAVLPEALKRVILSLHFPKAMRWGDGSLRFVRPIHWILALYDTEVIPFEIDGIRSGNVTKGHRFLSPGAFVIREVSPYIHLMENNYVIVDQEARKKIISEGIVKLALSVEGVPVTDDELVDTVTYLAEYPVPFLCTFPADFLELPKELLVTVMKDHQKFFAVEDGQGRLRNHFIVISNTKQENEEIIKTGAERVIKARFEDARFYYREDRKRPLQSRIEDLRRVTFHDRIGSLHGKTEKVVRLASFLAERLLPARRGQVERAAWLSKTDLVTGVVGEFPELQGLMGKYYAVHDGEDVSVAAAMLEQYRPAYSGDMLPETDEGALISIADKIDNIVSFFSIGLMPTGSEDPFALRRQAFGAIAILMERGYSMTLREIVGKAAEALPESRPAVIDEALQFLSQRLEFALSSQEFSADVVQALLSQAGDSPVARIRERAFAIRRFKSDAEYNPFLLAIKRINNITPKGDLPAVSLDLLEAAEEKTLYHDVANTRQRLEGMLGSRKYYEAIKLLATLTAPVNNFFDRVLVMDKREAVKLNRLALLREVRDLAFRIADFSKLAEM